MSKTVTKVLQYEYIYSTTIDANDSCISWLLNSQIERTRSSLCFKCGLWKHLVRLLLIRLRSRCVAAAHLCLRSAPLSGPAGNSAGAASLWTERTAAHRLLLLARCSAPRWTDGRTSEQRLFAVRHLKRWRHQYEHSNMKKAFVSYSLIWLKFAAQTSRELCWCMRAMFIGNAN